MDEIDSKALEETCDAVSQLGIGRDRVVIVLRTYLTASGLTSKLAALEDENKTLREKADRVCWFDWSDNDYDAVKAVEDLRAVLSGAGAEKVEPGRWSVSVTESDGRTYLCLTRDDGVSAALSCRTASANGETIVSQVVKEFAADYAAPIPAQQAVAVKPEPNWNGWRSIDTAPEDQHVILGTSGGHVGEAIMLIDEDTGQQKWAWALGPLHPNHTPYGWQPLPSSLSAPVLSDLRDGGFDGPTGAE